MATSAGSNYSIQYTGADFAITARPIYITANSGQTKVYGESDPTFTYTTAANTTGSGLMGVYDGVTLTGALARATGADVATNYAINQGTLAISSGSNYSIQYTGADFAISARPIYVTANSSQSKVYGETDPTFTYTTAAKATGSGLMGSDGVSLTGALARATGSDVATNYAINQGALAISSGSNYSIQYTGANFAITTRPITVTPTSGQAKVYGEADSTLTYSLEASSAGRGLVVGDSFSGALARAVGEDVNSYSINQGSLANSNYAISMASVNFAITARPIYVTANSGQTKVYGETDPTFTYTTAAKATGSGLMGTDGVTLTGALARATGADVATNYAINRGTLAISSGSNYSIQYTGADFAITARPIYITANAGQTKVYGESDPTFTYTTAANTTGSGLMGVYDGVTLTGALARATGADVATNYAINQGTLAAGSSNYSIQYTGANFAITAKPVVISSSNSATTYNGVSTYEDFANAAGFSTNVPLIGTDAIGSFTQAVTVGGVAVSGIAQAGSFVATPSAAIMASGSASNYAFTYSATTNTVAKANLSITATASLSGNIYNGSAYTGTYTSTFLGADASLAVISGLATGTNVGTYASNIAVTGAVLDNYNAPTISDANLVISPRPIAITPTQVSKVEGDDDPVMEVTISAGSLAPADNLSDVMAAISRTAGEEVASYDILMSMGAKASNYDISYDTNNAAFSITDRPVVSTGSGIAGAILVIEDEEYSRRGIRRERCRTIAGRCFP